MCFVQLLKHWCNAQSMQIKWGKHLSELFHITDGVYFGCISVFFILLSLWCLVTNGVR